MDLTGKTIQRREMSLDGKVWTALVNGGITGDGAFASLMAGKTVYMRYILTITVEGAGAIPFASEVMLVTSTLFKEV